MKQTLHELVILGLVGTKEDAILLCHPMANSGDRDGEPFDSPLGFALEKFTADEVFKDWRQQLLRRFFPWEDGSRITFPAIISYVLSKDPPSVAIRSITPLSDSTLDNMLSFTSINTVTLLSALEELADFSTETETRVRKLLKGENDHANTF